MDAHGAMFGSGKPLSGLAKRALDLQLQVSESHFAVDCLSWLLAEARWFSEEIAHYEGSMLIEDNYEYVKDVLQDTFPWTDRGRNNLRLWEEQGRPRLRDDD